MYVTVPRGMMGLGAGDLPPNMPCPGELADQCQAGLQCCDVSSQVPGMLPMCMTPGKCAQLSMKLACEIGGGVWSDAKGGCDYGPAVKPKPPPPPAPPGPAPSVPAGPPPAAKPTPAVTPDKNWYEDPLVLGAGVVLVGIVAVAATRKKKPAAPPRA